MSLKVRLRHAFEGFALDIEFGAPPGVTALYGPSGSGKTSVINAVAGLFRPREAHIELGGRILTDTAARRFLPPHRRRIGYVFQDARLFPHLSVRANLLYGARFAKGRQAPSLGDVASLLGIAPLLGRRPGALSGGEAARVAIGRALLAAPDLLLMDEPLASLDPGRKAEILPYIERLATEARVPILYVSHALSELARIAATLVLIDQGRVLRAGPVAEVLADPDWAAALGPGAAGALLVGRVVAHHADGLSEIAVSAGRLFLPRVKAPLGAALRLRIEARDVMLSLESPAGISALNVLPACILRLKGGEGPGVIAVLQAGGDRLLARITRRSAEALGLAEGREVFAVVKSLAVPGEDVGTAL